MKRFLWLGFVLSVYLICSGCGDTFRPIIVPNPPTFPNPRAAHTVVAINDNGDISVGSAMVIDVSGGSDQSTANVGLAPVHAVQQTVSQVLVVNHSVTGALDDSITKLTFNGLTIITNPPPTTITLPANSAPTFIAIAPSDTTAYVTLPGLVPDPVNFPNDNAVGVVNTQSNQLTNTITVGNNPVALAVMPDKTKLYVANFGDSTISGFNTVDRSPRVISPATTPAPPVWLVARTDNQRLYVLEQNGALDSIDTTSAAGPDMLTPSGISVPGATTMVYDSNQNRLYIAGGQQMKIVGVSQSAPQLLSTIAIPPFALLNPPLVSATAVATAALPDGSKAYVASFAVLPSQFNVSAVSGDGTTATYAYTLTAGHDLTPGVTVTVTTMTAGFDGTFLVAATLSGTTACPGTCFQSPNTTNGAGTAGSGTGSNVFPQVTVVDAKSYQIKSTIAIQGFPDATVMASQYYVPACASTRFRFMMAAGGDSSSAYLSSCDGGNVNIIDTSIDANNQMLTAPIGSRPPIPPSNFNPSQNPIFLFAGP